MGLVAERRTREMRDHPGERRAEAEDHEALRTLGAPFAHLDADEMEDRDRAAAAALRERAAKLYRRGRDYGLRALSVKNPGFADQLKANPKEAAKRLTVKDVPVMYWTSISWAGALAASRDMFMLPEIPRFEALLERALELNEAYDDGALHSFMITFEMASPRRLTRRKGCWMASSTARCMARGYSFEAALIRWRIVTKRQGSRRFC